MAFSEGLREFQRVLEHRRRDVLIVATLTAHESIKLGSPVTGAAGQPVRSGNLKNSWQYEFDNPTEPTSSVVSTNVEYAVPIEEGAGPFGPMHLRSQVGGFHSVAQTVAGWLRVVAHAVRVVNPE